MRAADLQVAVKGPNPQQIEHVSRQVVDIVRRTPNTVDIDASRNSEHPTLAARVADLDRRTKMIPLGKVDEMVASDGPGSGSPG